MPLFRKPSAGVTDHAKLTNVQPTQHHSNVLDHAQGTDTGTDAADFVIDGENAIKEGDSRLADARTPLEHGNEVHSDSFITIADVTYETLAAAGDVGSGGGQVADGEHSHPGGAVTAAQVELDFGSTPLSEKSFTVVNASVGVDSILVMAQSLNAPTGKEQDENEMDAFSVRCVPGDGEFTAFIESLFGNVIGNFKFNYTMG